MSKRALISVFDKTGIVDFAKQLSNNGYEIVSTGGTYSLLKQNSINVIQIDDITGFPECFDGRVKTLHPKVHGGILFMRDNEEHIQKAKELGISGVDIVVVNLYPFKETVSKDNCTFENAIENIDIGGPTMIRAAAKNHKDVAVVVDPSDYNKIIDEIKNGDISCNTKFYLFKKAFALTANYDTMISNYFNKIENQEEMPKSLTMTYEKMQDLRYGENPHQKAAYYKEVFPENSTLVNATQLHGKELSYNNINDTSAAIDILKEFEETTVVAVKHANPCAVASGKDAFDAYSKCYNADPVSIFGGIIACNREIDENTAIEMNKIFLEIIIAPSFSDEALQILMQKKNLRLMVLPEIGKKYSKVQYEIKKISGGLLIQEADSKLTENELKFVTNTNATKSEIEDLMFAWKVVKHTKSNAIVLAKDKTTLGLGMGQTSRIWASEIAIAHSLKDTKGAVMASDAYFPFPDSVEAAAKAGISAIIQPGGSVNDQKSIDECNKNNISMAFTGMRHFKH